MKNIFFSMLFLLSFLFILANVSNATLQCSAVTGKAVPCLSYATGKAPTPAPLCCSGLQQLAQSAKTPGDRKTVCQCLKNGIKSYPGVQDKFLSKIPGACKINVGFIVSTNTNCDAIH